MGSSGRARRRIIRVPASCTRTGSLPAVSAVSARQTGEVPDSEYPLVLSTGRRLYHYHTRTQTGRCVGLNDLLGEETADISLADAATMRIEQDEKIRVKSRRGEVIVKARVTPEVPPGMVWMAFHFRENSANWLTNAAFDTVTMTAEYKACAVRIEKL
jgi:formate dehydrogenase major subunit